MPDPHDDVAPRPLDIRPLAARKNLVHKDDFAEVLPPVEGFLKWFDALPDIYGSKSLKHVVSEAVPARACMRARRAQSELERAERPRG